MKIILVDAVDCLVSKDGKLFKEMFELLETYPNKKIILTGANDEQFKTFGLDSMPYEVFTLKHSPEKTDPMYYEQMLSRFGLSKNAVIYFDHNPGAVQSARSIGIETYFYDNDVKDLVGLKDFIDSNIAES